MEASPDPRAGRTRDAILIAFRKLALERRYDAIRVTDLIATAGIGRATFYEHFRGKDNVLLAAMEPILDPMARAALGRPVEAHLRATLGHIWQQRFVGRILLASSAGEKLQRHLAGMIATGLDDAPVPATMRAAAIAAAQIAMLRLWLGGTAPCPSPALARQMMACSRIA
jgi:AcrR family transcriptional regulator